MIGHCPLFHSERVTHVICENNSGDEVVAWLESGVGGRGRSSAHLLDVSWFTESMRAGRPVEVLDRHRLQVRLTFTHTYQMYIYVRCSGQFNLFFGGRTFLFNASSVCYGSSRWEKRRLWGFLHRATPVRDEPRWTTTTPSSPYVPSSYIYIYIDLYIYSFSIFFYIHKHICVYIYINACVYIYMVYINIDL